MSLLENWCVVPEALGKQPVGVMQQNQASMENTGGSSVRLKKYLLGNVQTTMSIIRSIHTPHIYRTLTVCWALLQAGHTVLNKAEEEPRGAYRLKSTVH